jgi:hypothetical protein
LVNVINPHDDCQELTLNIFYTNDFAFIANRLSPEKMQNVDSWAKEELKKLTKDFGFSDQDINEMIKYASTLITKSQLQEYFAGFLGPEVGIKFVNDYDSRKNPSVKLQGAWQSKSLDLVQNIQQKVGVGEEEAQSIITQAKGMEESGRKEYIESLMGPGFESQRVLILIKKMVEKEQREASKERFEKDTND